MIKFLHRTLNDCNNCHRWRLHMAMSLLPWTIFLTVSQAASNVNKLSRSQDPAQMSYSLLQKLSKHIVTKIAMNTNTVRQAIYNFHSKFQPNKLATFLFPPLHTPQLHRDSHLKSSQIKSEKKNAQDEEHNNNHPLIPRISKPALHKVKLLRDGEKEFKRISTCTTPPQNVRKGVMEQYAVTRLSVSRCISMDGKNSCCSFTARNEAGVRESEMERASEAQAKPGSSQVRRARI